MAEGDGAVFNYFKQQVLAGAHNMASGGNTFKVILATGWSPTIDGTINYATFSGVTEESGTGYNVGGETLGSQALTQDDTNDLCKWDGADVTWTGLDIGTPGHAIIYNDTHASDAAVAYWTLGTTATNGGNYTLAWNASGILTLS